MLLLKKLTFYGLEKMVLLPKSDLREMSEDLTFTFSGEISKDKWVNIFFIVTINNEEDTVDQMLEFIDL